MSAPVPLAVELVRRQLDAYNAHDLEAFTACFTPDVSVHRIPGDAPLLEGRESFRRHYAELFEREPELRVELLSRILCGHFVVDHEKVLLRPGAAPRYAVAIYEAGVSLLRRVWFLPVAEEAPGGAPGSPPASPPGAAPVP